MDDGLFIKTDDFTFSNGPPLKWLHASDCQENETTSFGSFSGTNLSFSSRIPLYGYKPIGSYRMVMLHNLCIGSCPLLKMSQNADLMHNPYKVCQVMKKVSIGQRKGPMQKPIIVSRTCNLTMMVASKARLIFYQLN